MRSTSVSLLDIIAPRMIETVIPRQVRWKRHGRWVSLLTTEWKTINCPIGGW